MGDTSTLVGRTLQKSDFNAAMSFKQNEKEFIYMFARSVSEFTTYIQMLRMIFWQQVMISINTFYQLAILIYA